jgi:hypothetical protein
MQLQHADISFLRHVPSLLLIAHPGHEKGVQRSIVFLDQARDFLGMGPLPLHARGIALPIAVPVTMIAG